jgi:hypothetical protein
MGSELLEIYFYMRRCKCIFYAEQIILATILIQILDSVDIQSVTLLHKSLYSRLKDSLL